MRGAHTTSSKLAVTAAFVLLFAFAMSACTPSGLQVEQNMAKSFARKVDHAKGLTSTCVIIGSDSKNGSFLSECRVFGSDDYFLLVRVSTEYQAGVFAVSDPYPRSAGGFLTQVDGEWTYSWAA